MEKNKEKELDVFLKKAIKEIELEAPSLQFTDYLLAKIEAIQEKKGAFVYEPIISKVTWIVIAIIVLSIFGYGLFGNYHSEIDWWPTFSANTIFKGFTKVTISRTYIYGFVGLSFFLSLQVYMIKTQYNKRFTLG